MLRHHWLVEEYTCENSESVKIYARIVRAFLYLLLKLPDMTAYPTIFQLMFEPVIFLKYTASF